MDDTTIRILLYSHDAQGLGHVRRNLAIAHHLAEELPALTGCQVSGLLVSGVSHADSFPLPKGFDWLTIPGVTKGLGGYEPRNLAGPAARLMNLRSVLLESTLLSFGPDLVIIDRHIYGVWKELREPLHRLRTLLPDTKVVLGLREVLDDPAVAVKEWRNLGDPGKLRAVVDEVWVYGDQQVHDPVATGEAPITLGDRTRFTGYLAEGRGHADHATPLSEEPFILTTAGGGSDGYALMRAAAGLTVPEGHRHILVTGPQLDENELESVRAAAGPRTQVLRSVKGLGQQIDAAAAVITMGGYNSVCEVLATTTPALVVPREEPRTEQLIRARSLQEVGALDLLRQQDLSTDALSQWVAGAVGRQVDRSHLDLDGLRTVSRYAAELTQAAWAPAPERGQVEPRIGYVLKVYPRFSETFVVTEILAREALGDDLRIYAMRPTSDTRFHPEIARVKAEAKWMFRPYGAITSWEQMSQAIHHPRLRDNFAHLLPELSTLPGDEVAQGVALAKAVLDDGITHLHAHFASLAGRMAWIASRLTGVPYTVTTHAKDIYHESVDPVWLRRICNDAERVIAISRFNEDYLRGVLARTKANVSLQYNALELDRFPYQEPIPLSSPLQVAAVGRLVPKKGFADLVSAVALARSRGLDVRVRLAGEGGLRAALEDQIHQLGISDYFKLIGPRNQAELRELITSSHLFAAPCVTGEGGNIDGLPTVVLEAMACGTPVVATAVSGLPEVVRDGDTGVLLEPGDVEALAATLERVAAGEVDLLRFSRNARALIEEQFDSRKQAATLSAWQSDVHSRHYDDHKGGH